MAKSILSKSTSESQVKVYSLPFDSEMEEYFDQRIIGLIIDIKNIKQDLRLYPEIKNSSIFKNLVKISQEFVKIASTQEGV